MNNKSIYKSFLLGIILIGATQLVCSCTKADALKNRKVILKYVKENYGDDYRVIKEYLGNSGASGRQDDILTISQDGITYKVSAKDGQITKDTYSERYAGKMVGDWFLLKATDSIPEMKLHDLKIDCSATSYENNDFTSIEVENILSYEIVMQLIVSDVDKETPIEEQEWLYDFYTTVCENIPHNVLSINIGENEKDTLAYTYSSSYEKYKDSYKVYNKKEFFDKFISYG